MTAKQPLEVGLHRCHWCGADDVRDMIPPDVHDEVEWEMEATYHDYDCVWVLSRAFKFHGWTEEKL